jgi:hypothetical protein
MLQGGNKGFESTKKLCGTLIALMSIMMAANAITEKGGN